MPAGWIDVGALLSVAALFGGMAFFAAVYAPLIFIKLEAATAGAFIREVFPVYYLAMGLASAAALALLAGGTTHGAVALGAMAAVVLGFVAARQILMPAINRARDAALGGEAGASRRFARLHRTSVAVNALQLAAVLVVLVGFVR